MITSFDDGTPDKIKDLLQALCGTQRRIRLFYGEQTTGKVWPEEHDVTGCISTSTGPKKIAILINSRRSTGGLAVLTRCIVGVLEGKTFLYKHPTFNLGQWRIKQQEAILGVRRDGRTLRVGVFHNGVLHARFSTQPQAKRYVGFMIGTCLVK